MKARVGDHRPLIRPEGLALVLRPSSPFRWLPRHGNPLCIMEWATQSFVKALAHPLIYLLFVTTLTLVVAVFGLPFAGGL